MNEKNALKTVVNYLIDNNITSFKVVKKATSYEVVVYNKDVIGIASAPYGAYVFVQVGVFYKTSVAALSEEDLLAFLRKHVSWEGVPTR